MILCAQTETSTLPGTDMEAENTLFIEENGLPRGHVPLPMLVPGSVLLLYIKLETTPSPPQSTHSTHLLPTFETA